MELDRKCRHHQKTDEETEELTMRLKRIEGQVRGIEKMVQDERYCSEILTQVMAAQAALKSFSKKLITYHVRDCMAEEIREGKTETVDEFCDMIKQIMA